MHPFLLYCCYFTKRKLCENCTINHSNMGSKPCDVFSLNVINKVNETEPTASKFLFENFIK